MDTSISYSASVFIIIITIIITRWNDQVKIVLMWKLWK